MATAVAALVAAAEAIKKAADAINSVASVLDVFDRSVILEVNNTSSRTAFLQGTNHDHGGSESTAPGNTASQ